MEETVTLAVEGEVEAPRVFGAAELAALPDQVPDVGQVVPGRQGVGVRLRALLASVRARPAARFVTLLADARKFSASVPLEAVLDGIIIYRLGSEALPAKMGGPFRFLIPAAPECHAGEIDACANVKFLERIQLGAEKGADTRPGPEEQARRHRQRELHGPKKRD